MVPHLHFSFSDISDNLDLVVLDDLRSSKTHSPQKLKSWSFKVLEIMFYIFLMEQRNKEINIKNDSGHPPVEQLWGPGRPWAWQRSPQWPRARASRNRALACAAAPLFLNVEAGGWLRQPHDEGQGDIYRWRRIRENQERLIFLKKKLGSDVLGSWLYGIRCAPFPDCWDGRLIAVFHRSRWQYSTNDDL